MVSVSTGEKNLKFIKLCIDKQVEFLLIGGVAVRCYGCREGDNFDEIDILIDRSRENAEGLMTALREAGVTPKFNVEEAQRPRHQLPLKYPGLGYNLDILTPWEERSYTDFKDRSEVLMLGPFQVLVVSKPDLITMKEDVVGFLDSEAEKFPEKAEMLRSQAEKHRKDLRCLH